ncbi:MAG: NAD-dependent epimerase/dehydratase family protein [Solirubrobacteraceae bacterium]
MIAPRRVLVTGASGFIGRHALQPLLRRGFEVHAVTSREPPWQAPPGVRWHRADLLAPAGPGDLLAAAAPTHLLHFAWYAEHGRFWTSAEDLRWTAATIALVQAFAERGGRRAVLAGTCAEYRWGDPGPRIEGVTPLEPATLYGTAKHATRALLQAASAELGIEFAWGRVFFLYGPGEAPGRLVASVARALLAGKRAATGDGTQIRDFLHVADVAGAFAALLDSPVTGAVNIASGEGRPLRDVIAAIGAATGREDLLDVGALPPRPGDPGELVAGVGRLRDEVGFVPAIGLRDGIEGTVAWWREQAG